MSDVVFILGAGASVEGGAPTMKEFLKVARALERQGKAGQFAAQFKEVAQGVAALGAAYEKAIIDSNNLESVFSAFEMAQLFGGLGNLEPELVQRLPNALRKLIFRTLEAQLPLRRAGLLGPHRFMAPEPYDRFVEGVLRTTRERTTAFLTFNYDVALDYAFHVRGQRIDYGLINRFAVDTIPVLKLHGSLNWTACGGCPGGVAVYQFADYFDRWIKPAQASETTELNFSYHFYENFPHCNGSTIPNDAVPLIIPPTWSKASQHQLLGQVWQHAAQVLRDARIIVVIGYSFPLTDEFFRYLYALGTISATRLEHFWVIDPDKSVTSRFDGLLGLTAQRGFEARHQEFGKSLDWLFDMLERHRL